MAIVLDGTSGITNDSGYTGDGVSFADSTPANTLVTTSGGNVGIGTSSPVSKLNVVGATTGRVTIGYGAGADPGTGDKTIGALDYYGHFNLGICASIEVLKTSNPDYFNGNIIFKTRANDAGANTERMRIDSLGNLLVGQTDTGLQNSNGWDFNRNAQAYANHASGTGSGTAYWIFGLNTVPIGSISQSGTTAVAYNTSSDYRLKHDIQPMTGALAKVQQLKPVTYKWNADDSESQGFIAHELQEVVPECVTGEKDAVDAEGKPQYQGIDTSFLVATLTAAIQEQQAIITALTARVEALEGAQG
jgi:hypothetical protein